MFTIQTFTGFGGVVSRSSLEEQDDTCFGDVGTTLEE
jgi:hypothetical protein